MRWEFIYFTLRLVIRWFFFQFITNYQKRRTSIKIHYISYRRLRVSERRKRKLSIMCHGEILHFFFLFFYLLNVIRIKFSVWISLTKRYKYNIKCTEGTAKYSPIIFISNRVSLMITFREKKSIWVLCVYFHKLNI